MNISLAPGPFDQPKPAPRMVTYRPEPDRKDRLTLLAASDASLPIGKRECQPDADPSEDWVAMAMPAKAQAEGQRPVWNWQSGPASPVKKSHVTRMPEAVAILSDVPMTAAEVARVLGIKPGAASGVLRAACNRGLAVASWHGRSAQAVWQYVRAK